LWAVGAAALIVVTAVTLSLSGATRRIADFGEDETLEGRVPTAIELTPAVQAVFRSDSYAPRAVATLEILSKDRGVTIQILHAGSERQRTRGNITMEGVPLGPARGIGDVSGHFLRVPIGRWGSGLYFARLTASDGRVGFAPFVVRPDKLGTAPIAVIIPTQTWQAYNYRDENRDGIPDTWYADANRSEVNLVRPFLNRGVPPHFRQYDVGYLRWFSQHRKRVDFLSDADLDRVETGDALRQHYRLIVFPGHEEYVTTHVYDIVERFRDLGGNLAFLSANNFFYRVYRQGEHLVRAGRWRDLGRPEARLVGVQYLDWNQDRYRNQPFVVTGARRAHWLFQETGLVNGSRFGAFGIEIDAPTSDSPPGLRVLAKIPDAFGPAKTATMSYYVDRSGAKVFAAGAFTLGGAAQWPVVSALLDNLWARLST
jgi:hypothetical protein